jgi:predicted transport protein
MVKEKTKSSDLATRFGNKDESVKTLFDEFAAGMKKIDSGFEVNATKKNIGFMKAGKNIVQLVIQQKQIIVQLLRVQPDDILDPDKRMKYVQYSMSDYGKHISEVSVQNESDLEYALILVREIFNKFKDTIKGWE